MKSQASHAHVVSPATEWGRIGKYWWARLRTLASAKSRTRQTEPVGPCGETRGMRRRSSRGVRGLANRPESTGVRVGPTDGDQPPVGPRTHTPRRASPRSSSLSSVRQLHRVHLTQQPRSTPSGRHGVSACRLSAALLRATGRTARHPHSDLKRGEPAKALRE